MECVDIIKMIKSRGLEIFHLEVREAHKSWVAKLVDNLYHDHECFIRISNEPITFFAIGKTAREVEQESMLVEYGIIHLVRER